MSVCETCRNYDRCTLEIKDRVNCCSFVYPKEENHDKEIRNKAIDELAEKLYKKSTDFKNIESDDYGMLHYEDVYKIAEQMKGE